jgi:hypothetical protein
MIMDHESRIAVVEDAKLSLTVVRRNKDLFESYRIERIVQGQLEDTQKNLNKEARQVLCRSNRSICVDFKPN